ncbi:MAG: PspA/IM30 family protein [Acidiferrobacterales bacterium]|nr:PspA/IM30 family protein [Acidiferrobacterales bacterium]
MNLIKRITTSVTATLDSAVGQLENHDAIIEATVKQTRQAVAKTKARINTLRQQQAAYETQLKEAHEQVALWTKRATNLADDDQDKALQCLTRRNQSQSEIDRLTALIEQQKNLILDVTMNLEKLQLKMAEISQKHNLMRSRQAVADVNRAVGHAHRDENINDTFERWESIVMEHEMAVNDVCARDPLETEFSRQETEAELLMQLKELTSKQNKQEK